MTKAMKWNFDKHEYEEVEISDDCCIFTENMQQMVECPSCGQKHKFGAGYASRQYHNRYGFAYSVCEKCYDKELENVRKEL